MPLKYADYPGYYPNTKAGWVWWGVKEGVAKLLGLVGFLIMCVVMFVIVPVLVYVGFDYVLLALRWLALHLLW